MIDWKFIIQASLVWGLSWFVLDLIFAYHHPLHGFAIAFVARFLAGIITDRKEKLSQ